MGRVVRRGMVLPVEPVAQVEKVTQLPQVFPGPIARSEVGPLDQMICHEPTDDVIDPPFLGNLDSGPARARCF